MIKSEIIVNKDVFRGWTFQVEWQVRGQVKPQWPSKDIGPKKIDAVRGYGSVEGMQCGGE